MALFPGGLLSFSSPIAGLLAVGGFLVMLFLLVGLASKFMGPYSAKHPNSRASSLWRKITYPKRKIAGLKRGFTRIGHRGVSARKAKKTTKKLVRKSLGRVATPAKIAKKMKKKYKSLSRHASKHGLNNLSSVIQELEELIKMFEAIELSLLSYAADAVSEIRNYLTEEAKIIGRISAYAKKYIEKYEEYKLKQNSGENTSSIELNLKDLRAEALAESHLINDTLTLEKKISDELHSSLADAENETKTAAKINYLTDTLIPSIEKKIKNDESELDEKIKKLEDEHKKEKNGKKLKNIQKEIEKLKKSLEVLKTIDQQMPLLKNDLDVIYNNLRGEYASLHALIPFSSALSSSIASRSTLTAGLGDFSRNPDEYLNSLKEFDAQVNTFSSYFTHFITALQNISSAVNKFMSESRNIKTSLKEAGAKTEIKKKDGTSTVPVIVSEITAILAETTQLEKEEQKSETEIMEKTEKEEEKIKEENKAEGRGEEERAELKTKLSERGIDLDSYEKKLKDEEKQGFEDVMKKLANNEFNNPKEFIKALVDAGVKIDES